MAKIRWVEENWIEVEGGGWDQVNGTFEERGGESFIAGGESESRPKTGRTGADSSTTFFRRHFTKKNGQCGP